MSRSSAKAVRLALAPAEIALARPGAAPVALATSEPGLRALLPLVDEALAGPAAGTRRIEVIVSQHFVRHVVTPAPGKTLSRAEELALVKSTFESIYGDTAAGWHVLVQSQPPQFGLVGAALDAVFLAQLEQMLARHRFAEVHIRPLASFAAGRLPADFSGWWALAESGWLTLFEGTGRAWQQIVAQPVAPDWAAALPDLIARETELAPASPGATPVWIQAVGTGPVDTPAADTAFDWTVLPHTPERRGAAALLDA